MQVALAPSAANVDLLKQKQLLVNNALEQEEVFWHKKSSANWCVEGERNTVLYHNMVKRKIVRMGIHNISNQGSIATTDLEVKDSAVQYFTAHFAGPLSPLTSPSMELPPSLASAADNELLRALLPLRNYTE